METQSEPADKRFGAGGTPGGIGTFLLGFALACAGAWLLTDQVVVSGDYFASGFMVPVVNYRMNSFGLSLVPFILGIGFLFFDGKSRIGWLLTIAGLVIIFAVRLGWLPATGMGSGGSTDFSYFRWGDLKYAVMPIARLRRS